LLDRAFPHVGLATRKTCRLVDDGFLIAGAVSALLADVTRSRFARTWWKSTLGHY